MALESIWDPPGHNFEALGLDLGGSGTPQDQFLENHQMSLNTE